MEEEDILFGGPVCAECTTNCLLNHVKERNPYCFVNRFFKVMLGDDFADVLFLPPRFARTVSEFVNRETYLEDSLGQRYNVTFSVVEDSLAFQDGWREFSVEHGLEEGDFLVFHHIRHTRKSYFIVHILGKSGCEKLNFPQENGGRRKRSRIDATASAPYEGCGRQDMNLVAKQSSFSFESKPCFKSSESQLMATNNSSENDNNGEKLQLVPSVIDMEEPLYMLNRDDAQNRDDRICLYDLSSFEMPRNMSTIGEANRCVSGGEGTTVYAGKCIKSQEESGLIGIPVQKDISSSEITPCRMEISRNENIEESGAINVTPEIGGNKLTVSHSSLGLGISSKTAAGNENLRFKAPATAKQKNEGAICFNDSPASAPVFKNPFENKSTTSSENVRSSFATNGNDKIVKVEPVDSLDISTSSAAAAGSSVVVVDDQPFLTIYERLHTCPSGQSEPADAASAEQVYTSLDSDRLVDVRSPSKQPAASSPKSFDTLAASGASPIVASLRISPVPAVALTSTAPSVASMSPRVASDSGSTGRVLTISEILESIKRKRKLKLKTEIVF